MAMYAEQADRFKQARDDGVLDWSVEPLRGRVLRSVQRGSDGEAEPVERGD
jgi:hypothetical protein